MTQLDRVRRCRNPITDSSTSRFPNRIHSGSATSARYIQRTSVPPPLTSLPSQCPTLLSFASFFSASSFRSPLSSPLFRSLSHPVPLPAPETSIVCRGPNPNLNPNLVLASLEQSWAVFSVSSSRSRFLRVTVVVLNSTGVTEHIRHISSSAALAVSDVSSYTSFFYTLSPLPLALSFPSLCFPSFVAFQRQKHPLLVD